MSRVKFKTEYIVAILRAAAAHGGSCANVVRNSETDLSPSTLHGWVSRGRRDLRENKRTALAVFATQFDAMNPDGTTLNAEGRRVVEMQEALKQLNPNDNTAQGQSLTDKHRSRRICECGQPKEPTAVSCTACKEMDSATRRTA